MRRTLSLLAVTALLVAPSAASSASAAATPTATHRSAPTADETAVWSVKPADNAHGKGRPNYAYGADPGTVVEDAVVVTNYSADPLTLALYAADGFTTSSGLLDLLPAGRPSKDLGSWVRLDRTQLTLAPRQSVTVPFRITVPAGARPGDHTGGVVTSLTSATADARISLDRRLASRIHLRVSGALEVKATVSDLTVERHSSWIPFASNDITVRYRLTNSGNTRIYAHQAAGATGPLGLGGVAAAPVDLPEVLPGSTVERTVLLRDVPALGWTRATLDVAPVGVGIGGRAVPVVSASAGVLALSWPTVAVLVLLAAAVVALVAVRRKRRSRAEPPAGTGTHAADAVLERARREGREAALRDLTGTA